MLHSQFNSTITTIHSRSAVTPFKIVLKCNCPRLHINMSELYEVKPKRGHACYKVSKPNVVWISAVLYFWPSLFNAILLFQNSLSEEKCLIIKKPRTVQHLKSEYIYSIWEFAAEFGGWIGVLCGFSALDIFNVFMNMVFS